MTILVRYFPANMTTEQYDEMLANVVRTVQPVGM